MDRASPAFWNVSTRRARNSDDNCCGQRPPGSRASVSPLRTRIRSLSRSRVATGSPMRICVAERTRGGRSGRAQVKDRRRRAGAAGERQQEQSRAPRQKASSDWPPGFPHYCPVRYSGSDGLRSPDELAWILLERAHRLIDVFEDTLALNRERLVLAQAGIAETVEADGNLLHPNVDIVGQLLDRLRRIAELRQRALGPGGADEALGARDQPVDLVGRVVELGHHLGRVLDRLVDVAAVLAHRRCDVADRVDRRRKPCLDRPPSRRCRCRRSPRRAASKCH